ncbi:MAG: hypothetical protein ACI9VT_003163 [Psychroserpens sp.]|jgi:hypothetical protein
MKVSIETLNINETQRNCWVFVLIFGHYLAMIEKSLSHLARLKQ